ncbi:MAG: hypothetical protein IJY93_07470 [Clostridia bacterium]|nr:hypothetical protein [Clostridia bacterium]
MRNSELKQLINAAYEMADVMYLTPIGQFFANQGVKPFKELLNMDLMRFVSYLGNVKGIATEREAVLFKDCYNDPNSYIGVRQAQAALDLNLEGNDYTDKLPFLLTAYLSIDKEMSAQGTDKKGTASRLYIDLFKDIGVFFLEFNNDINPKELCAVQQYTSMLEDARNNKLSGVINEEYLVKEKTDEQPQDEDDDDDNLDSEETPTQTSNKYNRTFAIGTKGEGKKDKLLRSFDVLKNDFTKNSKSIADIVSKMFEIDKELAIDMWTYLITEYNVELGKSDAFDLTGKIFYGGSSAIGKSEMDEIVIQNNTIKNAMFLYNRSVQYSGVDIIQRKIIDNELQIADELLELSYNNEARRAFSSWYEIMDYMMPNCKITSEAYELLEMWCEKVDDTEERAKLLVQLTQYDE